MKKNTGFAVLFVTVVMFLFSSCVANDYASESTINIENNSSYDLRLTFLYNIQLTNHDPDYQQSFDINIEKSTTHSFKLFGGLGSTVAPNPNWKFAKVIFSNLNDETILSDIEICDFDKIINNLFQLIDTKNYKHYQEAIYLLKITDSLLKSI